jgi:integrase
MHLAAVKLAKLRFFTLYVCRHSYLTRLGASGMVDPWSLARIAGWSNINQSMTYIHPSDENVFAALERSHVAMRAA